MKVLVFLCVVGTALATRLCQDNEHYESCGTACPLTCRNYQNPPKSCVLMCVAGCHCDKGYVRRSWDGNCVKPEQCPRSETEVCGENQVYKQCGTACPLTCENYKNPPKVCVAMCVAGCHCAEGYVKTADGRCVKPEQCDSVQDALDRPDCDKAPETGFCKAYFERYYYDQNEGRCKTFVYGGCGGNRNNFKSEEECYNKCGALSAPSACEQERYTGPCRAYFLRYYFDKESGQCERFVYGGCQGNDNNFGSREECESLCLAQKAPSDSCQQEKTSGPCFGFFPRFYFNKKTNKCERFIYGGCQGNENNFKTREECESACLA